MDERQEGVEKTKVEVEQAEPRKDAELKDVSGAGEKTGTGSSEFFHHVVK